MGFIIDPFRFGLPVLGRTFLPTSGGAQSIFGGLTITWAENGDALDALNTFPGSGETIEAPGSATFADFDVQVTVGNSVGGAPASTAEFTIRQATSSAFTSVTNVFVSSSTSIPAGTTGNYLIEMPKTRIDLTAGRFFRVLVTQTGSSSLTVRRGTSATWIDIDWLG